jgi:tetratricopeptide (TPR) repeat protein
MAHARSLHESGFHAQAAKITRELFHESTDPHRKLESGSLLIDVLTELADVPRARDVLQELRMADPPGRELEAKLLWCKALIEERNGNLGEAVGGLRATVALLEQLEVQRTPEGDELLARAYTTLALCRNLDGSNQDSAWLWSMADNFLDGHPWLSPQTTAQILCHVGMAQLLVRKNAELAESSLLRAFAIAERNSLPREAADVAIGLGSLYLHRGDRRKALESARWGLELSRKTHGTTEHTWRCLNVATLAHSAGSPTIAAKLARQAIALGNPQRLQAGLAKAIESSALLAAGNRRHARWAADEAVAMLRTTDSRRLLGSALRVNAEVNYALEFFDDARTAIEESVELLSRYGNPGSQARAVQSRAKIFGRAAPRK